MLDEQTHKAKKAGNLLIAVLIGVLCLSLGVAALINAQRKDAAASGAQGSEVTDGQTSLYEASSGQSTGSGGFAFEETTGESASSEQIETGGGQESAIPDVQAPVVPPEGVVPPAHDRVGQEYLNDAVFIGDSITEGLKIYLDVGNATILSVRSMNPDSMLSVQVAYPGREKMSLVDGVKTAAPKKVYAMIGTNGIAFLDKPYMIDRMGELVDQIRQAAPGAAVYLQSIPPFTALKEQKDPRYSIAAAAEYNQMLMQLCTQKGIYYLDVQSVLRDESGYLPASSSQDGIHFDAKLYNKWLDYLLTHTA